VKFRASEIAAAVGGILVGADVEVDGAAIDSRLLVPGQLFVPVRGDRDGHEFLAVARSAGAAAVLTSRDPVADATSIVVVDVEAAFSSLGALARDRLPDRLAGITGSVGKTSAKDLAAAVLSRRLVVTANEKSFNNELGVPLTLVNAGADTEITVVEMGSRGVGHIDDLCAIARPTIAVVTAVELAHSEFMGGLEAIARAKGELVEALPSSGVAILNGDNVHVAAMASRTAARSLLFGIGSGEVRAVNISIDDELRAAFRLESDWGSTDVRLAVRGAHHIGNALAAAAVALVSEVSLEDVAVGLGDATISPWRMDLQVASSGARILNDSYNAGPASMAAALRAIAHLSVGRHFAVLGPMAELGDHSEGAHREVAALASVLGVRLIAFRTDAYGVDPVETIDAAVDALGELGSDDAVLVKGSRIAGLERLAAALLSA
jgi:UDP-N-acetylmuramoyl-tripeptide--D-alanyl-D-alanine ligase